MGRRAAAWPAVFLASALIALGSAPAGAVGGSGATWSTLQFNGAHTGYNRFETTLGVANVGQLAPSWTSIDLKGSGRGQPVVADGLVFPGDDEGHVFGAHLVRFALPS